MLAEIHDGGSRCCTQAQQWLPRAHSSLPFLPPWPCQSGTAKAPATVEIQLLLSAKPVLEHELEGEVKPTNQTRSLRNVFSSSSFVFFLNDLPSYRFSQKRHAGICLCSDFGPVRRLAVSTGRHGFQSLFQCTQKQPASTSSASTNRSELM